VENPLENIGAIKKIRDPAARAVEIGKRMKAIPDYQKALREMRQEAVLELRAKGMTYSEIGTAIGLHRNRVQQIAEGRTAGGQGGGTGGQPKAAEE
jgi:hypothetical protein